MPVIKSAKKRMRQNIKRRKRNFPLRSELKTVVKKMLQYIKDGKAEDAAKYMPRAFSIIDTACKKNIIHKNNAARKKSRIARGLNDLIQKSGKKVETGEPEKKDEKGDSDKPEAAEQKEETKA